MVFLLTPSVLNRAHLNGIFHPVFVSGPRMYTLGDIFGNVNTPIVFRGALNIDTETKQNCILNRVEAWLSQPRRTLTLRIPTGC